MTQQIRFAHLADLHLGGWREKRLTDLNFLTFQKAIDRVILEKVDFCLFAGDIFNNAMPPIDLVTLVVKEMMRLKEADIPLYVIGGSHDYSNSGKSFLELLDSSGVFKDVFNVTFLDKETLEINPTVDFKTGTRISGVLGRKKGLDKNIYKNLSSKTLSQENFNIFMFHCTLDDFKPDFMKAVKVDIDSTFLPGGFDYYAGGHVHTHIEGRYSTGVLSYPGPLFPNNFSEVKRERPIFNLCTFSFETRQTKIEKVFLDTYQKEYVLVEINNLTPLEAKEKIEDKLSQIDIKDKIVLIEVKGIVEGKISDVQISSIVRSCYDSGAFHVLKNTYKLSSATLEKSSMVADGKSIDEIESEIVDSVLKDSELKEFSSVIHSLLKLELSKNEDEKNAPFEQRVVETLEKSLNIMKD